MPADKKAPIEAALNKLKEAHKAQNIADIDAAMAELNNAFHAASEQMYNAANQAQGNAQQQQNPNAGQQSNGNNSGDGNVQDADFEEVK